MPTTYPPSRDRVAHSFPDRREARDERRNWGHVQRREMAVENQSKPSYMTTLDGSKDYLTCGLKMGIG